MATEITSQKLLFTILWLVGTAHLIDARCGYPELPGNALINVSPSDNWQFFEEGSFLKVECTTGLLGRLRSEPEAEVSNFGLSMHYNLSTSFSIWCQNGQWNSSGLVCVRPSELRPNSVQFQDVSPVSKTHASMIQKPENINVLADKDATTCVPLMKSPSQRTRKLIFRVDLEPTQSQQISRIVLVLKHKQDAVLGQNLSTTAAPEMIDLNNLTVIENFILDINEAIEDENESDTKKFADFLYSTEFHNPNQTRVPQFTITQTTLNPDHMSISSLDTSKSFIIDGQKVQISAALGNTEVESGCGFTENAQFSQNSSKMEMLMFDCGISTRSQSFRPQFFMVKIDISLANKNQKEAKNTGVLFDICGLESFELAEENCNKPFIPIYGTVKQVSKNDKTTVAEYGCDSEYFLMNTTGSLPDNGAKPSAVSVIRTCDHKTGHWSPASVESLVCQPKVWCKAPPPMPGKNGGSFRFFFEFTKLDYMRRAVGGHALATLRCQTLTELVWPYTVYVCNTRGEWVLIGDNANRSEPECRVSSLYRSSSSRRYRNRHHYHHYYHLMAQQKGNHTNTHLFGRSLNDNKMLVYVGVVGLVLLFGGSFIVLFHVRRMAKKISRQMRERSYMGINSNEGSMVIGGKMDGYSDQFTDPLCRDQDMGDYNDGDLEDVNGYPPYYSNSNSRNGHGNGGSAGNYYDMNVAFSTDLPEPATPISMPATVLERKANSGDSNSKRYKNGLNLAANFDNAKF